MIRLIRWLVLEMLIILARIIEPMRKRNIPFFVYHSIDASNTSISISTEAFEQHLSYLRNHRYTLVDATAAVTAQQESQIPRKCVGLTFDDAYVTIEPWIENLLLQNETATVFVPSAFIGQSNRWDIDRKDISQIDIMTAEQLQALKKKGCELGAHTRTHPNLTELSHEDLRNELKGVRDDLKQHLNDEATTIAYPYGAHNDTVIEATKDAGYIAGFTTQLGYFDNQTHLLRIPRFPTNISFQVFRLIVHGGYGWYRKLQDRLFG